jgi:hypothetical protein
MAASDINFGRVLPMPPRIPPPEGSVSCRAAGFQDAGHVVNALPPVAFTPYAGYAGKLTWLIGASWLIRGAPAPQNNQEARIHHDNRFFCEVCGEGYPWCTLAGRGRAPLPILAVIMLLLPVPAP